tara:strand:- start:948 stop:1160 length:213 start_codon:yes stop_codon:yes gene_type:complete
MEPGDVVVINASDKRGLVSIEAGALGVVRMSYVTREFVFTSVGVCRYHPDTTEDLNWWFLESEITKIGVL